MSKLKLTTIISLLTVSTLAFSACDLVAPDDPKLDNMTMQDNTPRMEGNEDAMMDSETEEGEAMMEGEDSEVMTDEDETMMDAEAPKYVAYTAEMYEMLKGEKPFVIYFHATWCPTCNVLDGKIKDAIADFPAGTIILNADYDEQTELKKRVWC